MTLTNSTFDVAGQGSGGAESNIGFGAGATGTLTLNGASTYALTSRTGGTTMFLGFEGGSGNLAVNAGSQVSMSTAGNSSLAFVGFSGNGSLNVNGGTFAAADSGTGANENALVLVGYGNGSNGTVTVNNGGVLEANAANGNIGAVVAGLSGGTGALTVSGAGSTVEASTAIGVGANGTLGVVDGGVLEAPSVEASGGGDLFGNSEIEGNLTDSGGQVDVGDGSPFDIASLLVTGNYTQNDNGVLDIDIAGTHAVDDLVVGGSANLTEAMFNFDFGDSFVAQAGDVFRFLTFGGGLTQSNLSFDVIGGTPGLDWAIGHDSDSVYLEVLAPNHNSVPAPGALALLGLGLVGFGAMRRRNAASSSID
jgi:hypothetical protein